MSDLLAFLEVVLGYIPPVAGGALAIAAVVDGLKKVGWLPDGYAQLASLAANAALMALLYFLGDQYGAQIQDVLDGIVEAAPIVVTLLLALVGTKQYHNLLVWLGLGYSHDNAKG